MVSSSIAVPPSGLRSDSPLRGGRDLPGAIRLAAGAVLSSRAGARCHRRRGHPRPRCRARLDHGLGGDGRACRAALRRLDQRLPRPRPRPACEPDRQADRRGRGPGRPGAERSAGRADRLPPAELRQRPGRRGRPPRRGRHRDRLQRLVQGDARQRPRLRGGLRPRPRLRHPGPPTRPPAAGLGDGRRCAAGSRSPLHPGAARLRGGPQPRAPRYAPAARRHRLDDRGRALTGRLRPGDPARVRAAS